jgi:hypothetical protein
MRWDILVAIFNDEPLTFYVGAFFVFSFALSAWSIYKSARGAG